MSADGSLLKGDVDSAVVTDGREVEQLLLGLLNALLHEQTLTKGVNHVE
jgi:hypothetical protein